MKIAVDAMGGDNAPQAIVEGVMLAKQDFPDIEFQLYGKEAEIKKYITDEKKVKHMCDNIAIMYKGRFVEIGTRQDIYTNPQHIYTKRLLSAIPKIDVANREAHKEERRRVEQEYRENHKDYYDENGRVYNLHAISPTHQVALKNGGAE